MPPTTEPLQMTTNGSSMTQKKPLVETNETRRKTTSVDRQSLRKETIRKSVKKFTEVGRKSLKKRRASRKRQTVTTFKGSIQPATTMAEQRLEEAIAEIVLMGSSSSTVESEVFEEEGSKQGSRVSDSNIYQLMEHPSRFMVADVESEESSSEESEHLAQDQLESEQDFFEVLGYVPSVDEVSADESEKDEVKAHAEAPKIVSGDTGTFVDPLAGILPGILLKGESSSITSVKAEDHVQVEVQPEAEAKAREQVRPQKSESSEEEHRSYKSRSSDFSDDYADSEKKTKARDKLDDSKADTAAAGEGEQETYLQFLELQQEDKTDEMEIDVEALLKEQQRILNIEQTMEFLNNLIDICVDKAEYIDEEVILRKNLDRDKVTAMLKDKLRELYSEKKKRSLLDRQCAIHFRHKNSVRHLMADDNTTKRKKTFYEIIKRLDNLLKKEQETKVICSAQIVECREEFEAANENIQEEIQKLEKLIKSTFQREKFDKLKDCVNNQIHKMSTIRDDISAVRLRLFLSQHQFSDLSMQLTKLEDLGNGLNLRDYDNLETETKALGKRVEERNNHLKKLHHHCNAHIHTLAHIKEKHAMMNQIVSIQTEMLQKFQSKKRDLRHYITELSKRRNRSRHEIRQLSFQCGLLDKPNLMVDYDRTVATANEMKALNDELKQIIANLTNKIALLEERCTRTKRKFKQK